MNTEVKTYDPAQVAVSVGGVRITGFEAGTFVSVARAMNNFEFTIGPDGQEGIRTKRNNRSGLVTIVLRQTSPSNLVLSNLAALDEASNSGVVPVSITDAMSPDTKFLSGKAWVEKPADAGYGEAPQGRSWLLRMASVDMKHAGTPADSVLAEPLV